MVLPVKGIFMVLPVKGNFHGFLSQGQETIFSTFLK